MSAALASTAEGLATPLRRSWLHGATAAQMARLGAVAATRDRPELARMPASSPFSARHRPPPGVLPEGEQPVAMDSAWGGGVGGWAEGYYGPGNYAFSEGLEFLGYPYLAQLAQRPEYRRIVEVISTECTRKWIRVTVGDDQGQEGQDRVGAVEEMLQSLAARDAFRKIVEQDGYYGRAHLLLDLGDDDRGDETMTPIGDGLGAVSRGKVNPRHPLLRLGTVEAVWTYPTEYNADRPWRADWYRPAMWYVMGKRFHVSRLLCVIGREVPDLLKPAYSFGGLALTQMVKPYVDNWLQTRQSVNDIVSAFSQMVLKTDMSQLLEVGGEERLNRRIAFFNNLRNNRGVMALDKDAEDFSNVAAPLAGLHELQGQAQEHMASVSGIPVVKLLGIQPAGLNASSEGELRAFYDWIAAYQESLLREPITRILRFVQLSLFGEVDPSVSFEFNPLWALDEAQQAQVDLTNAQADQIRIDSGQFSAEEARSREVRRPGSPYGDLEPDAVPDLLDEEEQGLEPQGGRPQPQADIGEEEQGAEPALEEEEQAA